MVTAQKKITYEWMGKELREDLSEYAHAAWSGWMEYMFSKCETIHRLKDGTGPGVEVCLMIPAWAVERWTRQMNTPYADLSEEEKESDRDEADKMLSIVCDSDFGRG